jgi:DNA topoisomerase-1
MKLIITEKEIAGRRIAEILAGKKVPKSLLNGAPLYRFGGKGKEVVVFPLRGHIVDVDFPVLYSSWLGTDIRKLVDVPAEYMEKEKVIIGALRKVASEAGEVIIATDADREGEAIGVEALDIVKGKQPKIKVKRALFSAITPKEITDAFSGLEDVDYHLADSANSRREIDLVWGAALTRFLSLISGRLGKDFISAGRVQTPVLAVIVLREKERLAFRAEKYWQIAALFEKGGKKFEGKHKEGNFRDKTKAEKAFSRKADYGTVVKVTKRKKTLNRPVPFNTTEFLRAATSAGFSAAEAMSTAEHLYQSGYTSYPRTDNQCYPASLNLTDILKEISKNPVLGKEAERIMQAGKLKPSSGKMSKDHPPVHPAANCLKEKVTPKQWKIYELIVRRFFATLAEDAVVNATNAEIDVAAEPYSANGQVIVKRGWKEFYPYSKMEETLLPEMKEGDRVKVESTELLEKETMPPSRYSQSGLIKKMEELGLGTKSTRAEIIQKLYNRRYVTGAKSIEPNKLAFAIIDALQRDAEQITKHNMTAELENEMDKVALGKKEKEDVVGGSREMLKSVVDELSGKKKEISADLRKAARADSVVGKCLKCGSDLRMLTSRRGKRFVACAGYPECRNTFPLPQKGSVQATDKTCEICGEAVVRAVGKRYRFDMCINPDCPSKEEWKRKRQEKEEAERKREEEKKEGAKERPGEKLKEKKAEEATEEKGAEKEEGEEEGKEEKAGEEGGKVAEEIKEDRGKETLKGKKTAD